MRRCKNLNKLIKEATLVLGCSLNGFEVVVVVEKRTLNKLIAFLDNKQHPLHDLMVKQWNSFSRRLLQLRCRKSSIGGHLYREWWRSTTPYHCAGTLVCMELEPFLGYAHWTIVSYPPTIHIHMHRHFTSIHFPPFYPFFIFTLILYILVQCLLVLRYLRLVLRPPFQMCSHLESVSDSSGMGWPHHFRGRPQDSFSTHQIHYNSL